MDCFCCFKRPASDRERKLCSKEKYDQDKERSLTTRFVGGPLARFILSPIGMAVVIGITALFFGIGLWGALELTMNFDIEWFAPDDSYLHDAWDIRDSYFGSRSLRASIYTKEGNYFTDQQALINMNTALQGSQYIIASSVSFWFPSFISFAEGNVNYSPYVTAGQFTNETAFYEGLVEFLGTAEGSVYKDGIVFTDNTNSSFRAAELTFLFVSLDDAQEQIDAMDNCRDIASDSSLNAICYAFSFIFFEGNAVIQEETIRNVLIAGAGVFVACVFLLAKPYAAAIVLLMVGLVDVSLLGFAHHWGVYYNSVSAINIVLAVGLSVDYSAHIVHSFLVATGTRKERAIHALNEIGGSVVSGATSTFLAVVLLSASQSFVFQTFFKMFTLIVVFGLWHGVMFLPVLLALIGPESYYHGMEDQVARGKAVELTSKPSVSADTTV